MHCLSFFVVAVCLVFHQISALVPTDVEDFLYGNGISNGKLKGPSRHGGPVRNKDGKGYSSSKSGIGFGSSTALKQTDKLRSDNRILKRDARFFVGNGGTFEVFIDFIFHSHFHRSN